MKTALKLHFLLADKDKSIGIEFNDIDYKPRINPIVMVRIRYDFDSFESDSLAGALDKFIEANPISDQSLNALDHLVIEKEMDQVIVWLEGLATRCKASFSVSIEPLKGPDAEMTQLEIYDYMVHDEEDKLHPDVVAEIKSTERFISAYAYLDTPVGYFGRYGGSLKSVIEPLYQGLVVEDQQ